jgi:HlyD family secretion protein
MPNPLFRESALQNLSSPEQLDQLIKITQPRSWIVLAGIGFILAVTVLWSIFGSLPTTLTGQGIIIRTGGTFDIVALGNGIVTDFGDFKVADVIHKGDVIGHVDQPVLAQQIEAAKIELARLEKLNNSILAEIGEQKPVQNSSIKQQTGIQRGTYCRQRRSAELA